MPFINPPDVAVYRNKSGNVTLFNADILMNFQNLNTAYYRNILNRDTLFLWVKLESVASTYTHFLSFKENLYAIEIKPLEIRSQYPSWVMINAKAQIIGPVDANLQREFETEEDIYGT